MATSDLRDRLAAGDPDAFSALVAEHADASRRLAMLLLRNAADADDAVQEGFLAAWRAIRRYDPARPFRPWLMRIMLNASRDLRRRRRRQDVEPLLADRASEDPGPDQHTSRALLRERLATALESLPERQRLALTLFDAEGYSHAEIAELLGLPEGTVRSMVFHARRRLRGTMEPFLEEVS